MLIEGVLDLLTTGLEKPGCFFGLFKIIIDINKSINTLVKSGKSFFILTEVLVMPSRNVLKNLPMYISLDRRARSERERECARKGILTYIHTQQTTLKHTRPFDGL